MVMVSHDNSYERTGGSLERCTPAAGSYVPRRLLSEDAAPTWHVSVLETLIVLAAGAAIGAIAAIPLLLRGVSFANEAAAIVAETFVAVVQLARAEVEAGKVAIWVLARRLVPCKD